jgi:copper chaperone CopZ
MRTKILNIALVVVAAAFLTLLSFYVRVGATADSVAVLRTSGMTCSSCSNQIMTALQRVKGVAVTEVDVEGGWVVVGYDTKTVNAEMLAQKVNGSGFASDVHRILTPEQFKQITGREIGKNAASVSGCCGGKGGGCNSGKQN